jgi:hypothetical protein
MRERRLCVRGTFLFLFFSSLASFPLCFLFGVLVHVSSLSVHGYRFFFVWIAFVLSLFVPPSPFKNVLCSTVILRVSIRSPLSPPFPPPMFGFLTLV